MPEKSPAPARQSTTDSGGTRSRKSPGSSPIRAAWGTAHRAVALTWIVGTGLLLGGIAVLDESSGREDNSRSATARSHDAARSRDADRFRDAATISLVSAAIAHVALLPGTWIGRRASMTPESQTPEYASPDRDGATPDRDGATPDRDGATPDRDGATPGRERASADQESAPPSPARQSVAGDHPETLDRPQDNMVAEKNQSDGHDGVVAWFAGTLIRLFGTVALVGCYRYQLSENGDPSFYLAAIVGWYLVLTFVEVWVLAKALPAQDRP